MLVYDVQRSKFNDITDQCMYLVFQSARDSKMVSASAIHGLLRI
jgi:hypothetical protein